MNSKRYRQKLKTATGWENQYPIIDPIQGTYAQINAARIANTLIPFQWYKITDYATNYTQPVSNVSKIGANEPLYVFALSVGKFSHHAKSSTYEKDLIWYDFETTFYNWCNANSKGCIYRRISENFIDAPYDFRGIYFARYAPASTFQEYNNSLVYNKGSIVKYLDLLYFAKKNVPINNNPTEDSQYWIYLHNTTVNNPSACGVSSLTLAKNYTFSAGAFVFDVPTFSSSGFGSIPHNMGNIKIEPCYVNILSNVQKKLNNIVICGTSYDINFASDCENMTLFGNHSGLNFGSKCKNNTLRANTTNCNFGHGFQGNYISGVCTNNNFGNNCKDNLIGSLAGNIVENDFQENIISNNFNYNTIGSKFQKKTIKPLFQYNKATNNLFEEKDLDSALKLFDENMLCEITKGINTQIPETVYAIRFFDPIGLTDEVNVI